MSNLFTAANSARYEDFFPGDYAEYWCSCFRDEYGQWVACPACEDCADVDPTEQREAEERREEEERIAEQA